jgi:hypothetical protein
MFGYEQAICWLEDARLHQRGIEKVATKDAELFPMRLYIKKLKMSEFIIHQKTLHPIQPPWGNVDKWMGRYSKQQRKPFEIWKRINTD